MVVHLKGITWNHTRGYVPMVATSQRYSEMHPDVRMTWEKRSLQEFADYPISTLTGQYDLIVIDHPWAGFAANQRALVDLAAHLPDEFLEDQRKHSVGASHPSYLFNGYQSALAIDAATPVSSRRADLMEREGFEPPSTWEELLELADAGKVVLPGIPIDTLMNFYMFCLAVGEEPFVSEEQVVSRETAAEALDTYRELIAKCTERIFDWNPIAVYEAMTQTDEWLYCPFAYGYSNYSRPGYARRVLDFGDLVAFRSSGPLRSTLGGTGIAISAETPHLQAALDYVRYVASPEIQRTLYAESGGQPGHCSAWLDEETNRRSRNYFLATYPALERAYLRPRYDGYLQFQDHAGAVVQEYLRYGGSVDRVMDRLNRLYAESIRSGKEAPR